MDMLDIEDKRLDLRRKQWEALCEKYEILGEINTADCSFSEVNYKMFIKSTSKRKFKARQNKAPKNGKIINNRNTEVANVNNKNKAEKGPDNTVSSTFSFISNGPLTSFDSNYEGSVNIQENVNPKNGKIINNRNTEVANVNNKNKAEKGPDNTVSSTFSFISNGPLTSFDSNYEGSVNIQENVNLYKTESIDSGLGMDDKEFCDIGTSSNSSKNIDTKYASLIEMCNLKRQNDSIDVHSTGDDHLHTLIRYIEKELKSNLKVVLKQMRVSKLLELDGYSYWHKCTKEEMRKLSQYISKDDLKEYMRHCYSANIPENNMRMIDDVIVLKLKSNLHRLFFKREHSRHDKTTYLKYHTRVILEWRRFCKIIPVDYLLLYGTAILKSFEEKEE